jgi:hypothetical protein
VPHPPPMMSHPGAIPKSSQRTDPDPDPVVTSPPASSRSRAASAAGSVADPSHLMEQGTASLELQQAAAPYCSAAAGAGYPSVARRT